MDYDSAPVVASSGGSNTLGQARHGGAECNTITNCSLRR